jgi:hypothetical protein
VTALVYVLVIGYTDVQANIKHNRLLAVVSEHPTCRLSLQDVMARMCVRREPKLGRTTGFLAILVRKPYEKSGL